MNAYELRLMAAVTTATGSFLLIEHLYRFGFEFFDFIGHEWYGLLLIIVGCGFGILSMNKGEKEHGT